MAFVFMSTDTISWVVITLILAFVIHIIFKLVTNILAAHRERKALKDFTGPTPHWLYGNIHELQYGKGMLKIVEWSKKYGPVVLIHVGPFSMEIILTAPEYIQTLTNTSEPKDPVYNMLIPWLGDGLLISRGQKWARNRRLLTPGFHFDILKPYMRFFSESSQVMVQKWQTLLKENPDQSIEMFEHVSLMTLDSLMKCVMGLSGNFQTDKNCNPYISQVYTLSKLVSQRFRFFPHHNNTIYYLSRNGYKFRKACKATHDFTRSVIEKKRQHKSANTCKPEESDKRCLDFLDILLDCRDEDGKGLTDQEIQDEVDTFMFEGHDTTASGLSWCLYNLARYPEYQEKCREEILNVLGDRNEVLWDNNAQLKYVTMCIKESLRIHPPVSAIGRQITKPMTFPDGSYAPAGTLVTVSTYACHHNPDIWPDPETYDPERFNPDNPVIHHTHAFVPFSAGPRNCIGKQFAMNELRTAVALVLKNFRLSVDSSKPAEMMAEVILRSKSGVWLKLEAL